MGLYLNAVFAGRRTWLSPVLRPVERVVYWVSGVDEEREQDWKIYTVAMLMFTAVTILLLYGIERLQNLLPLNPQGQVAVDPVLAWNTAVSFSSNTNWQNYGGETTMSYLTQMAGLAFHNFASAAVGVALAVAVIRGLTRRSGRNLGNFWVDITRCILYILLPICIVYALFLIWQGVPQNFNAYTQVTGIQGFQQLIAQGPIASQEAIKMLGTNGGGFLNANSAHPFENPTPFTNLIQMLSIFALGAGLIYMFGKMANDTKQGWILFSAVSLLFLIGAFVALGASRPATRTDGDRRGPDGERVVAGAAGRQHGGQGDALRHRLLHALRHHHHRRLLWRGQQLPRQLHAYRWAGPADQHRARRDRLWRCGLRSVWSDGLRDPLGLHRRPDGWTHA